MAVSLIEPEMTLSGFWGSERGGQKYLRVQSNGAFTPEGLRPAPARSARNGYGAMPIAVDAAWAQRMPDWPRRAQQ